MNLETTDCRRVTPTEPAGDGGLCSCGAARHATKPDRCGRGHVVRGNATAKKHGLTVAIVSDALRAEREAFYEASLIDDGDDVPTRRRALHEYRSRLHAHITQLSDALERFTLLDKRGRLRGSWLQRLDSMVTTAARLDVALGLARRQKHLDPLEAVRVAVERASRDA